MRIGRGLFRLWVVASVIWVIGAGIMTWQTFGLKEPVFAPGWEIESVDGKPYMVIRAAERREALEKGASPSRLPWPYSS
jgi:hypothetical protein